MNLNMFKIYKGMQQRPMHGLPRWNANGSAIAAHDNNGGDIRIAVNMCPCLDHLVLPQIVARFENGENHIRTAQFLHRHSKNSMM